MKNFSTSIIMNYEVGRSLEKAFMEDIKKLFDILNKEKLYDNYHLTLISVVKYSNGTQSIAYALKEDSKKILSLVFKKTCKSRYVLTFKNSKEKEIISISAPKFKQISDMVLIYLPDFIFMA